MIKGIKKLAARLRHTLGWRFLIWAVLLAALTGAAASLAAYAPPEVEFAIEVEDDAARTVRLLPDLSPDNPETPLFKPEQATQVAQLPAGERTVLRFRLPEENALRFALNFVYTEGEGTASTRLYSLRFQDGHGLWEIPLEVLAGQFQHNKAGSMALQDGYITLTIDGAYTKMKGQYLHAWGPYDTTLVKHYAWGKTQTALAKHAGIFLGVFLASFAALVLFRRLAERHPRGAHFIRRILTVLFLLGAPLLIFLCMELPDKGLGGFAGWPTPEFRREAALGLGVVALLYWLLVSIAGGTAATALLGLFGVVLAVVHQNKVLLRSEPVYPWDIFNASTFANVAGNTSLTITRSMGLAVLLVLVLTAAAALLRFPRPAWEPGRLFQRRRNAATAEEKAASKKVRAARLLRVVAVVTLMAVTAGYLLTYFLVGDKAMPLTFWNPIRAYSDKGLAASFAAQFQSLISLPPEGYSRRTVEAIVQEAKESRSVPAGTVRQPNIILVLGESFWDVQEELPALRFDRELCPNLHRLQEEAVSGTLLVPAFGGGTVNTEFSVLTGFNNRYHRQEPPYTNLVRKDFYSLASYYKSQGYETLAMHAWPGENYNRANAWPMLGFEDTWFGRDDYTFPADARTRGRFISDELFVEQVAEQFNRRAGNGKPLFQFAITLQNHPQYSAAKYPPAEPVALTGDNLSPAFQDGMLDMASTIHAVDRSLGQLAALVDAQEEPTLLVYFGDHKCSVTENPADMFAYAESGGAGQTQADKDYQTFTTPFIAYSNFADVHREVGAISSNFLMPVVLDLYGLPRPLYFDYLQNSLLPLTRGAHSGGLVLHGNGEYSFTMTAEEERAWEQLALVQYDYISGKRYGEELFTSP